jgi:hypothetical protein
MSDEHPIKYRIVEMENGEFVLQVGVWSYGMDPGSDDYEWRNVKRGSLSTCTRLYDEAKAKQAAEEAGNRVRKIVRGDGA